MSVELDITIVDKATPRLNALQLDLTPKQLASTIGPRLRETVRDHLRNRGTNKRGWPTTNFWERAARATRWEPHPQGVLIIVDQIGVRQRFQGGTIRPVNAGALTIPISPVSYGKTAADFPGAFILRTPKGSYIVQKDADAIGKETKARFKTRAGWMGGNVKNRRRATFTFLFKLVSEVTQDADSTVMPDPSFLKHIAIGAIIERVKRKNIN